MSVAELATLLRERQPCVVLTGAGISTESGIPDFRSPSGIWGQYDPMEYATIDAFRRDHEARCGDVRRAATGRRDGARARARPAGGAVARRGLYARGLSGGGAAS